MPNTLFHTSTPVMETDGITPRTQNSSMAEDNQGRHGTLNVTYDPVYFFSTGACSILIGILGIVGNILLLCVMKRPHLRNKSYAHFLSALAICDTSNILFNFFHYANYTAQLLGGTYLTAYFHNVGCKVYDFVGRVFLFNSAWLIVCITIERFLVIYFPTRGRIFCRARKALTVVLVVCAASCCSQAFRLAWVVRDALGLCSFEQANAAVTAALDIFFEALLFYVVPSSTILILNILTLVRMNGFIRTNSGSSPVPAAATATTVASGAPGSREPVTGSSASSNGPTQQLLLKYFPRLRRNSRRATWILLTISFTYLLCCLPSVVGGLYWHVKLMMLSGHTSEEDKAAFLNYYFRYQFVLKVFHMVNYASNFYTYMLFGKSFRREVTTLLNLSSSAAPPLVLHPPIVMPGGDPMPPPQPQPQPVMMRLPGAPPPDLLLPPNGKRHSALPMRNFIMSHHIGHLQRYRHMPEFPV